MGPHITDEELNQIEQAFADSTQGDWHFLLIRHGSERLHYYLKDPANPKSELLSRKEGPDPRWDVFVGEPLSQDEAISSQACVLKGRRQILHMHPESPIKWEKSVNLKDGEFVVIAHKMVPKLIAEIKRLMEIKAEATHG